MSPSVRRWLSAAGVLAMVSLTGSAWAQGGTGLEAQIYPWDTNSGGTSFTGSYSDGNSNMDHSPASFVKPEVTRLDGPINFVYDCPNQPDPNIGCNHYNIRYTGQVEATVDGDYTFGIGVDDGGTLWVSDKPLDPANLDPATATIDAWKDQGETQYDSAPITLKAGQKYNVVFDFYQNGSGVRIRLFWTPPGGQRVIIPASQLFPPAGADQTPPAAITDLKASNPTLDGVTLTWTAPADTGTGSSGNASAYVVRYAPVPLTDANFSNATQFTLAPAPQKAGSAESVTINGLDPTQHYYFGVEAQDTALNLSKLSNVADVVTPSPKAGGPGLLAQYFTFDPSITLPPDLTMTNIFDPKNIVASRIEPTININYNTSSPAGVPHDYFGVMYTGQIQVPADGDYTFCTASDDGSRLFVSDKAIDPIKDTPTVDNWAQQGTTEVCAATPMTLKKGTAYNLVELYEQGGSGANNYIRWSSSAITKEIIPSTALTSPASATVADTGRVTGMVVDATGAPLAGTAANVVSGDGKTSVSLTTDLNGVYTGLLPVGTYTIKPVGPLGLHMATSFQALPATPATANSTVAKDQIASVAPFTFNLPALKNPIPNATQRFQSADFTKAGTGWAFLQTMPTDTSILGTATVPNQANLNKFCDPKLSTTGASTIVPTSTWLADWDLVPGDAGGPGRNGDPDGIPDNTWWASALHFTPNADVAKGTQWTLTGFNQDDYFELACLNGVKIGGNTDADWSAIRTVYIPNGVLNTSGDNLLVLVGYEGGGGAGFNNTTTGPLLVAYGPDTGGGTMGGVLGDLNGDGKVDIKDATISLQIAVGNVTATAAQTTAGDVNKDGKLNIQDTTLILAAAVGIRTLM